MSCPLIASATATFLYRQMFMTIPAELLEAARIDGAGPWRFFVDVVLPLSRTNTAALFVVLFIYGWNQYLWPLLVTNQESMYTIVMGIQRMVNIPDAVPEWNLIMAVALLGMLPPCWWCSACRSFSSVASWKPKNKPAKRIPAWHASSSRT